MPLFRSERIPTDTNGYQRMRTDANGYQRIWRIFGAPWGRGLGEGVEASATLTALRPPDRRGRRILRAYQFISAHCRCDLWLRPLVLPPLGGSVLPWRLCFPSGYPGVPMQMNSCRAHWGEHRTECASTLAAQRKKRNNKSFQGLASSCLHTTFLVRALTGLEKL